MSTLLNACKELFGTDNFYDVLGIEKDASKQEVKKGYHKKSLTYHPDRASTENKKTATHKFQILSQVYNILSDDHCRAEYDETGNVEDAVVDQDKDWEEYWRLLFPKITTKDIQEFSEKYRGSEEELDDLRTIYISSKGDMDIIMGNMLCSTPDDEARFTNILKEFIKEKKVPAFDAFTKESKKKKNLRTKKAEKEAKEAEKEAKILKLDDSEDSLVAAIRQSSRARQADCFLSQLEAKYADSSSKAKKAVRKKKC